MKKCIKSPDRSRRGSMDHQNGGKQARVIWRLALHRIFHQLRRAGYRWLLLVCREDIIVWVTPKASKKTNAFSGTYQSQFHYSPCCTNTEHVLRACNKNMKIRLRLFNSWSEKLHRLNAYYTLTLILLEYWIHITAPAPLFVHQIISLKPLSICLQKNISNQTPQ